MTRWVRWAGHNRIHQEWHATDYPGVTRCGMHFVSDPSLVFSDFEPVEDECRHCRRALDGGKTA